MVFAAMSAARITHDDDEALAPPSEEPAEDSRVFVAGHEVLFASDDDEARCDVCERPISDDDDEGHAVSGRGLYVWTRGEDVATTREEPPLCPSCAAALGLTALARWEIEEEEG
jgi:hypothetical protein